MPTEKKDSVTPEIRHESGFVHYGFNENGVFHPVASERQGDYNDRVAAEQEESD